MLAETFQIVVELGEKPNLIRDKGEPNLIKIADGIQLAFKEADTRHREKAKGYSLANHDSAGRVEPWFALSDIFKTFDLDLLERIVSVRMTLNDYARDLGIGIVSVKIEPLDRDSKVVLSPDDVEGKAPTMGSVLPRIPGRQEVFAGFKITKGSEQLNAMRGALRGNIFAHGVPMPNEYSSDENKRVTGSLDATIITQGSTVAVYAPVLDIEKLEAAEVPHYFVTTKPDLSGEIASSYMCRYLTNEAAFRLMEKKGDAEKLSS